MRILFDYKIFYQQKFGGISNYFYNLCNELLKEDQNILFSCGLNINEYIKKINSFNKKSFYLSKFPSRLNFILKNINQYLTNENIKKFNPDVVHETYYSKEAYNKKKTICTVYDMINEKFSKFFPNSDEITRLKKLTVLRADHIICISEQTKEDLINFFKINENKITVTLLASTLQNVEQKTDIKKFDDCLLFVGSRHGYKNFNNLIKAYSISNLLKNNFKIIAYGGEKFSKIDKKILEENKIDASKIIFMKNDQKLEKIYSNVKALIYPSYYEGFGLPVLEAMQSGCPVISSDGGSLKEVGGDGIEYFDPNDPENISNVLEKILSSEQKINQLINYGFERSKQFSWNKCAKDTLLAYNKIR